MNPYKIVMLVLFLIAAGSQPARSDEESRAMVERYLVEGRLDEGAKALSERLAEHPEDAHARFGLGIIEVLQAVENLAQGLHRFGLRSESPDLPFVRLPVPNNPDPEPLTYEKFRGMLGRFVDDLEQAAETLGEVDEPDVKLRLPVGLVRLDLNGDGRASEEETFWKVFTSVAWRAAKLTDQQKEFPIGFDAADVHWMIGYTHLLRAMAEAWLAYDTQQFFDRTAHFFFAGVKSPYPALGRETEEGFDTDAIANLIAAIHLMRFEPVEPKRMSTAREHLLAMIAQSRQCWKHALAETDDDREWIPNTNQTSLVPLEVTDEIVAGWQKFLDEAEQVLNGEKLLPHWRIQEGRGINLKNVFEEPRRFDLVMWAHGAAAVPYLEEGELVSPETAQTLSRTFQGRFLVFAVWFQ